MDLAVVVVVVVFVVFDPLSSACRGRCYCVRRFGLRFSFNLIELGAYFRVVDVLHCVVELVVGVGFRVRLLPFAGSACFLRRLVQQGGDLLAVAAAAAVLGLELLADEQELDEMRPVVEYALLVLLDGFLHLLASVLLVGGHHRLPVLLAHDPAVVDGVREASMRVKADHGRRHVDVELSAHAIQIGHVAQVHAADWQHTRLEELHVAELVAGHAAVLGKRRLVPLRLPVAEQVEVRVVAHARLVLAHLESALDHLVGLLERLHHARVLEPRLPSLVGSRQNYNIKRYITTNK